MKSIVDEIEWSVNFVGRSKNICFIIGSPRFHPFDDLENNRDKLEAPIPVDELSTERVLTECERITNNVRAAWAEHRKKMTALLMVEA